MELSLSNITYPVLPTYAIYYVESKLPSSFEVNALLSLPGISAYLSTWSLDFSKLQYHRFLSFIWERWLGTGMAAYVHRRPWMNLEGMRKP